MQWKSKYKKGSNEYPKNFNSLYRKLEKKGVDFKNFKENLKKSKKISKSS